MISLGNRDGREGLEFGFGEMEETELEEGEACDYGDPGVVNDPDSALSSLSYIDEKIQHVLGHFQKDFEGGVSAENLGAKFGGYGSFLPCYQRSSSIWSQPRSPPRVQTHNTPKSPNNPLLEDGQNRSIPMSGSHSLPDVSCSANAQSSSTLPSVVNSSKKVSSPKKEAVNNRPWSGSDQKNLKLRIKVGPNSAARKNAAIYSGLGLTSPSSSLEDSPDVSEGLFQLDAPIVSPLTILRIMTSLPIPEESILSPLPNWLLSLTDKGKPPKPAAFMKVNRSIPSTPGDESFPLKEFNGLGEKKVKSSEKHGRPTGLQSTDGKDSGNSMSDHLKKEVDIETPEGRELVSNALKLPLLSNSEVMADKLERPMGNDTVRGSAKGYDLCREVNKGSVKDRNISSDLVKDEVFESMTGPASSTFSKLGKESVLSKDKLDLNFSSTDKMLEDKKTSSQNDISLDARKEIRVKGEKSSNTCKIGSDGYKGRTDQISLCAENFEQKVTPKAVSSCEQNVRNTLQGKESKKKAKGSQSNGTPAVKHSKGSSKDKKRSQSRGSLSSGSGSDASKSRKESSKLPYKGHRDFFGDTKVQQVDNKAEISIKDKLRDSKSDFEKEPLLFVEKSKDISGARRVENSSTTEAHVDAPSSAPVTLDVNHLDHWVQCDKCEKWRLLPYGVNSTFFEGKKWRCNMLNWLHPGMNKCTIEEEVTTKALIALYQLPVAENQNNVQGQYNATTSAKPLVDVQHSDLMHGHGSLVGAVRKKHGPNTLGETTPIPPPTVKKNQQSYVKSKNLTDMNQFPLEFCSANRVVPDNCKLTEIGMEKLPCKQKEKHKVFASYSDGGDYIQQSGKHSKSKTKREVDHDSSFTVSKKIKAESSLCMDEGWQSDCHVAKKEGAYSNDDLLTRVNGKDSQKHSGHSSSKDSKGDTRDNTLSSRKTSKGQHAVPSDGEYKTQLGDSAIDRSNEMEYAAKKRKLKEWQQSQGYSDTVLNGVPGLVKDEIGESKLRREKKAKSSKSEGRDSRSSKADGAVDKKRGATKVLSGAKGTVVDDLIEETRGDSKNKVSLASHRFRDGIDLTKREPGYVAATSTAATSSSSKISGSRKSRGNLLEAKDSPVESVSSSPLRGSNADKLTLVARRNITGRDDVVAGNSPVNWSDGEGDDGSYRTGNGKKENASTMLHGSLESQRAGDSSQLYEYHDAVPNQISSGVDTSGQHNSYLDEQHNEPDNVPEKVNNHCQVNGSSQKKFSKGSFSLSRDKYQIAKSDFDKDNVRVSDSCMEEEELYPSKSSGGHRYETDFECCGHSPYCEGLKDEKHNIKETCGIKPSKDKKNHPPKTDPVGKRPSEGQRDSLSNSAVLGSPLQVKQQTDLSARGGKSAAVFIKNGKSNLQLNLPQACEDERSSELFPSDRTDKIEAQSGRGKAQSFPPAEDKQELDGLCSPAVTSKGGVPDVLPVDASGDVTVRVHKEPTGMSHSARNRTPNGVLVKDPETQIMPIKEYGLAATKVFKEAKDLKHTANRMKTAGDELGSTNLFFRAALKFLHGASLLEHCNTESAKNGETTSSMKYYTDTASLCEFCAREYEKSKEMAAAALAFKCVEVAYMRVICSKHHCANKDQHKLQEELQTAPPGESSPSSASDADDIKNQNATDKIASHKGTGSGSHVGSHVIPACSRFSYARILSYVQDMNFAMEASRKSQSAFVAASSREAHYRPEVILSVRSVLDFNFRDVDMLIHLVLCAMEAMEAIRG